MRECISPAKEKYFGKDFKKGFENLVFHTKPKFESIPLWEPCCIGVAFSTTLAI